MVSNSFFFFFHFFFKLYRKERQKMIAMIEHDKPQEVDLPSVSHKVRGRGEKER